MPKNISIPVEVLNSMEIKKEVIESEPSQPSEYENNLNQQSQLIDESCLNIFCPKTVTMSPAPPTLLPIDTPHSSIICKRCGVTFCFCPWSLEWHQSHRQDLAMYYKCNEMMQITPE
ncbi:uncharacterized protein isoform X2 [Leptinotarsa decemlineata]